MDRRALYAGLAVAAALGLGACDNGRKVTESTGTATATVKTTAPPNVVSASDLQQNAQSAADAASTPVANATSNAAR